VVLADIGFFWIFVGVGQGYRDEPSLEGLECALLMLARRLRRFVRLVLEKPLTLSLMPPLRRLLGLRRLLVLVSSKESVDTDPPTAEET
jgi:hypothetical protein